MTDFDTGHDSSAIEPEYWKAVSIHPADNWFDEVFDGYNKDVASLIGKRVFVYESEMGNIFGFKVYTVDKSRIHENPTNSLYHVDIMNSTVDLIDEFTIK